MSLLDLLPGIKSAVVGPIRTVLISLRTSLDTLFNLLETGRQIIEDIVGIYHEIENFDIKPHWQTRALSVPDAITNVKDLSQVPAKIVIAVRDLIQRLKSQTAPIQAATSEAVAAVEEASAVEGFLIRVFPRLAAAIGRALARLLAIVGIITTGLVDATNTIADIRVLIGQFRIALESLNHLDAVFLRQNKKRKTFVLEDGTTIRRRIPIGHQK